MRVTRIIAVGVIACSMAISALTALQAQSLRSAETPAEFPPASFKGKQYVDSRGCVYIRAGIDGYTTWVPRVDRERKLVCGYKPTLGEASATVAVAPQPGPDVERITLTPTPSATKPAAAAPAKPAAAQQTPKPASQPTTTATAPAATAPRATPTDPLATIFGGGTGTGKAPSPGPKPTVYENPAKPAPKPQPAAQPVPKTTTARTTAPAATAPSPGPEPTVFTSPSQPTPEAVPAPAATPQVACPGASALSQKYINSGNRYPVRCGPQTESPVTLKDQRGSSLSVPEDTRVVPRHVYDNRRNTQNVVVPPGYQTVWDDGRLNPNRAVRTLAPYAPSEQATVPQGYKGNSEQLPAILL